jgi:hypothetical protein
MKFTKVFSLLIFVGLIAITLNCCKKKCKTDPPEARIINNSGSVANVQIKTSNGNTVNINNVAAGTSSDYASYAAGDIVFTITVNKIDYIETVSASSCYSYDIAIDNNYNISVNAIHEKYE